MGIKKGYIITVQYFLTLYIHQSYLFIIIFADQQRITDNDHERWISFPFVDDDMCINKILTVNTILWLARFYIFNLNVPLFSRKLSIY